MLSFACKKINFEEAMFCSLGLSKSEYKILNQLFELEHATIKELATSLNYDRSTVQKFIKNLLIKEIIKRRQVNLESGGYEYYYIPVNKENLKELVRNSINSWTKSFYKILDDW